MKKISCSLCNEVFYLVAMSAIDHTSRLLDVGRKTDKADRQTLNLCADHLRRLNSLTYAAEMYKYVDHCH